jgi:hypothetical protein
VCALNRVVSNEPSVASSYFISSAQIVDLDAAAGKKFEIPFSKQSRFNTLVPLFSQCLQLAIMHSHPIV